jgi:Putative restriction endonuclease
MATVEQEIEPLVAGDNLTQDEFLRRWEAMPQIKRAELIGGIVYMPSPLSSDHAEMEIRVCHWLGHYTMYTPGCRAGSNATWLMLEDSPQPDVHLRMGSSVGAKWKEKGENLEGAPEFITEICVTSAAYDLHQKLDLYRSAGVKEYVTVLVIDQEVRWHRLVRKNYKLVPASREGTYRSEVFPGLWLDAPALLEGNMLKVIETLERGLQTPEHAAFVKHLSSRRS